MTSLAEVASLLCVITRLWLLKKAQDVRGVGRAALALNIFASGGLFGGKVSSEQARRTPKLLQVLHFWLQLLTATFDSNF
ncbi:hypothetical protein T492DRAFT_895496 [Pavlovales sp. CCMP2436]|nr:hypothetical protein T492DRAFT_895496 [Pavlovales sp. CCMP2436]